MSIIKDWREDHDGMAKRYKVKEFLDPREWKRLYRWRKQRLNRGWSDRDAWGAGEHIAKMTAEMLQHLQDKSYTDWPEWFKLNVQEEGKGAYKNLQSVIDDINNYLEFEKTSWADDLTTDHKYLDRDDGGKYLKVEWFDSNGKKLTSVAVTNRMNKWHKEWDRLYKKAVKAMGFFGRHFAQFWD